MSDPIDQLLRKYILNQCNAPEVKKVVEYFQAEQATTKVPTVEDVLALLNEKSHLDLETSKLVYKDIEKRLSKSEKAHFKFRIDSVLKYAVAAAFIGGLIVLAFQLSNQVKPVTIPFKEAQEITLELDNGTIQLVNPEAQEQVVRSQNTVVAVQKGNKIEYRAKTEAASLAYNTIHVPYGKTFELMLSDSTVVHLNSGTKLRYPICFAKSGNREVFLEGEAFFQVAKDKQRPFYVMTSGVGVRVLGTQFNVSSYQESNLDEVVLVEGSVKLLPNKKIQSSELVEPVVLSPGDLGSYNKANYHMAVKQVSTEVYTSWMNGRLVFRNMTFNEIIEKLQRRFNVAIEINDAQLGTETFNASFDKDTSLEEILKAFKKANNIAATYKTDKIIIEK